MNKIFVNLLLGITFIASCFADVEEKVLPGSRPVAHTEWITIQEERSKENENTVEDTGIMACAFFEHDPILVPERPKGSVFSAELYQTSHNGVFHYPIAVAALGGMVELEDGSIWSVADEDRYKTLNWLTSDLIVLSPNHDWFSSHLFRMSNQNTSISIKCNLKFGPVYNGVYTHWIIGINYYTQEIFLEDGSIWQVTGFDSSVFNKWLLNDTVIIGINDGFLSATKPNILINVNTLTYARAGCVW